MYLLADKYKAQPKSAKNNQILQKQPFPRIENFKYLTKTINQSLTTSDNIQPFLKKITFCDNIQPFLKKMAYFHNNRNFFLEKKTLNSEENFFDK